MSFDVDSDNDSDYDHRDNKNDVPISIPDCPPYELISYDELAYDFKQFEKHVVTQLRLNHMLFHTDFKNTYEWSDIIVEIRHKPEKNKYWMWFTNFFN